MIEEEEVDVPVVTTIDTDSAMDTDKEPVEAGDAKFDGTENSAGTENGGASEQKPIEMDVEPPKVCWKRYWRFVCVVWFNCSCYRPFVQKDVAKKKKSKRKDIAVNESVVGGVPQADLQTAIEKEYEMALQDRIMEETKDKKNAVESYVYDMRNKVEDFLLSN